MKKTLFFMLPLMVLAASCEQEPQGGPGEAQELTITASTDGAIMPEWAAQEEIMVVCGEEVYTFAADKTGKTASFTDTEGKLTADIVGDNPVAAYRNCTNMFGTFRIQAEQTYADGASSTAVPAYAYTMNAPVDNMLAMAFKPLASVLDLTVAPYDIAIEKIIITPAEGAVISEGAIAGTFTVNASQGTVKVTNELNTVTITPSAPVDAKQGASFKLPVGWFTIDGGLSIIMVYDGGKEYPFTIWNSGESVKSYNDDGGLKTSKVISETLEFNTDSFPRDWYVKADAPASAKGLAWENATSLDNALTTALPGSTIHLAAGTYKPQHMLKYMSGTGDAAIEAPAQDGFRSFLIEKNIKLIGGYPANAATGAAADASNNATILDGEGKSYHVLVVAAPKVDGEKVVLEGITVKGGANNEAQLEFTTPINGSNLAGNYAAGLALIGTAIDLKNVTVTGNNGHSGVGVFCINSDVNMTGCQITENTSIANGSGAWITTGSKLVMDGCKVSKNKATAVCAGLYLYVPAEKSLEAEIRNCVFDSNNATGNDGAAYIRDDSGANLLKSSFTNCTFTNNIGGMGGCLGTLNANTTFAGCEFSGNQSTNNGLVYIQNNAGSSEVTFDSCKLHSNTHKNGTLYLYNNGGGTMDVFVLNSSIYSNNVTGRGGAIYARNNVEGKDLKVICANSTFAGNTTSQWGSAINMYGTATKKVFVDLISCTVTGNISTNAAQSGAISHETVGTTINTWNSIISGNMTSEGTACDIVENKAADKAHKCTIIGAEYYSAEGAVTAVTPAFDYTTMLGKLEGGLVKLAGNSSSNPAFGNGLTATVLKALAKGTATADILAKDQNGNARTDTDKIIGACVK